MRNVLVVLGLALACGIAGAEEKRVTLAGQDMELAAAARAVATQTGWTVIVSRDCAAKPVTADLVETPARRALEGLARLAGVTAEPLGKDAYWIGPRLEEAEKEIWTTLLEKRLAVAFEDTPLGDVLDHVAAATGLSLMIDPAVIEARGKEELQVSLKVGDMRARDLLFLVCTALNLEADVRWGGVFVSTKMRLDSLRRHGLDPPPAGRMGKADAALRKKLAEERMTFAFAGTPLPFVLRFLRAAKGVDVVIDDNAREAAGKLEITLKLSDVSVRNALDAILVPRGFVYRIDANEDGARVIILEAR